ncbi:MAG: hypothetical protein WBB07_15035, partial [Mycobacterium sp.]
MDWEQLADFLRIRREALAPLDVGLPTGARRRAVGLRREEIAALALISTDNYSRMERRRGPQPSVEVAARVAYARDGAGSRAAHIVDALLERSPDFATLWKHHDVAQPAELRKRILHPKL